MAIKGLHTIYFFKGKYGSIKDKYKHIGRQYCHIPLYSGELLSYLGQISHTGDIYHHIWGKCGHQIKS